MKQTLLIANKTNFDLIDEEDIIKAIKTFDKENHHDLIIIPIDDSVNWDNTINFFNRLGLDYNWVQTLSDLEEVYDIKYY